MASSAQPARGFGGLGDRVSGVFGGTFGKLAQSSPKPSVLTGAPSVPRVACRAGPRPVRQPCGHSPLTGGSPGGAGHGLVSSCL
eukprot:5076089-Prymnesium_polylepis.1